MPATDRLLFVAVDIGCLECHEPSAVLGVFTSRVPAEAACKEADGRHQDNWGGQHDYAVFCVPGLDVAQMPDPEALTDGTVFYQEDSGIISAKDFLS